MELIIPSGVTLRTRLFPVSAIKIFPELSIAIASGARREAFIAGPPSPANSCLSQEPIIVRIIPSELLTLRMLL